MYVCVYLVVGFAKFASSTCNTTLTYKLSASCLMVFVVASFAVFKLKCIQYHVAVAVVTFVLTGKKLIDDKIRRITAMPITHSSQAG